MDIGQRGTMDKHEVIKLLQSQQINPTRQRVDIAGLLFEHPQHLSADQLINKIKASQGKASKATVYNTLNLFSEHGLLREVALDGGKVYYDTNTSDHHHIYNVDTGQLWDIDNEMVDGFKQPSLPEGTQGIGIDVIYRVKQSSNSL